MGLRNSYRLDGAATLHQKQFPAKFRIADLSAFACASGTVSLADAETREALLGPQRVQRIHGRSAARRQVARERGRRHQNHGYGSIGHRI
jgi:hypothetical protein